MKYLKEDYLKDVSVIQIEAADTDYILHKLTGGIFRLIMCDIDKEYGTKCFYSVDFSDKFICDCRSFNKYLPLIFSNN